MTGPFPAAEPDSVRKPTCVVLERDPLARLLVVPAVEALGMRVLQAEGVTRVAAAPAVVFVPLDEEAHCRSVCAAAREAAGAGGAGALVAGYGRGPAALLSAHREHRCADLVLRLTAGPAGARFAHLPAADAVTTAGLTEREADVLVLLLCGLTTPDVAQRLSISSSTARSHCRAVLRKLGAADRRALRARLLAGSSAVSLQPRRRSDPEVCRGAGANFAEESTLASGRRGPHT